MIVLIPDRMIDASHTGAKTLLDLGEFRQSSIQTVNSNFSIFSYQPNNNPAEVVIVDVPTGLSTLRRIIELRLGLKSLDAATTGRLMELEQAWMNIFKDTLRLLLEKDHSSHHHVRIMSKSELRTYLEQSSNQDS